MGRIAERMRNIGEKGVDDRYVQVAARWLLDDVKFDLCDTPSNHS
jgi:hypothetical protein